MDSEKKDSSKNKFKYSNALILLLIVVSLAVFGVVLNSIISDRKEQTSTSEDDADVNDTQAAQLYVLRREPVVTSLGNNEYEIDIQFFVRNNNTREVINIGGTSNIQFAGNYQLISKSSDNLTISTAYDAKSNNQIFEPGQSLAPGEVTNLNYKFRVSSDTLNGLSQFLMSVNLAGEMIVPPPTDTGGGNQQTGGSGSNPGEPTDPPPPVDIETNLEPRTFQFRIMNVDTGEVIGFINEGDEIDVATLPTRNFTIEAIPNIGINGSVRFGLNGNNSYRNENNPGFFISGNSGDLFNKWNYRLGQQVLTASGYAARNGTGTQLGSTTINFVLIDSNPNSSNSNTGSNVSSGSADVSVELDFNNQQQNNNGGEGSEGIVDEEVPVGTDQSSNPTLAPTGQGNEPVATLPNTGIDTQNIPLIGLGIIALLAVIEISQRKFRNE